MTSSTHSQDRETARGSGAQHQGLHYRAVSQDNAAVCKLSAVEKFTGVFWVAVPSSSCAVFTWSDLAFQVAEKEAGGGEGGVQGGVVAVEHALGHLPAGRPTIKFFGNVWQEL